MIQETHIFWKNKRKKRTCRRPAGRARPRWAAGRWGCGRRPPPVAGPARVQTRSRTTRSGGRTLPAELPRCSSLEAVESAGNLADHGETAPRWSCPPVPEWGCWKINILNKWMKNQKYNWYIFLKRTTFCEVLIIYNEKQHELIDIIFCLALENITCFCTTDNKSWKQKPDLITVKNTEILNC